MDLVCVIQTNLAMSDAKSNLSESNKVTARSTSRYFPSDPSEDFMVNSSFLTSLQTSQTSGLRNDDNSSFAFECSSSQPEYLSPNFSTAIFSRCCSIFVGWTSGSSCSATASYTFRVVPIGRACLRFMLMVCLTAACALRQVWRADVGPEEVRRPAVNLFRLIDISVPQIAKNNIVKIVARCFAMPVQPLETTLHSEMISSRPLL
jgi:hypothetical protein